MDMLLSKMAVIYSPAIEWMEEEEVAIVHFEVCMWLERACYLGIKGSEGRGCVVFSVCSLCGLCMLGWSRVRYTMRRSKACWVL